MPKGQTKFRGGPPPLTREEFEHRISVVHECLAEGFPLAPSGGESGAAGGVRGAVGEAALRLGLAKNSLQHSIEAARREYDLAIDPTHYRPKPGKPIFALDDIPGAGEQSTEEMIDHLAGRHLKRKAHEEAAKLRHVRVSMDGPIGIAMFGDPHVDDPGCAWGDLRRDVMLCRDTPGVLAVDVGDDSNNWVGRLQRLYADQETTAAQALRLIEWLMMSLPWLLRIKGNHDAWNTDKGDPADFMHRGMPGLLDFAGARVELHLPSGASAKLHVRHDFAGGSQFNPAHALVRETLFGFRDHILACGHRHVAGYIPVYHEDPKRLCHGFRLGTYKDFDKYAKEKGFREGNWARSMMAIIDPDYADDPVRFIRPAFSIEEGCEYLTWRRSKWDLGKRAA